MPLTVFDPKFKRRIHRYVFQVSLATAARSQTLMAAIASTAFVLFITPHSDNAEPRHVLGGH